MNVSLYTRLVSCKLYAGDHSAKKKKDMIKLVQKIMVMHYSFFENM